MVAANVPKGFKQFLMQFLMIMQNGPEREAVCVGAERAPLYMFLTKGQT